VDPVDPVYTMSGSSGSIGTHQCIQWIRKMVENHAVCGSPLVAPDHYALNDGRVNGGWQ
jgi:hypothetical protein